MYVYEPHARPVPRRAEGIGYPESGVTDNCE